LSYSKNFIRQRSISHVFNSLIDLLSLAGSYDYGVGTFEEKAGGLAREELVNSN
jgi:hypothetical protein